jgi:hypothetical protein
MIIGDLVSADNFVGVGVGVGVGLSRVGAIGNFVGGNPVGVNGGFVPCVPPPLAACRPDQTALPGGLAHEFDDSLLGTLPVSISNQNARGNGSVTFNLPQNGTDDPGNRAIVLIGRDVPGNTLEFSQRPVYTCDTIFKQNIDDASAEPCPLP